MMKIVIFTAALFLIPAACSEDRPKRNNERVVTCTCIGVSDGDTITVLTTDKKQYKIRLEHIDCPEKSQPFGKAAKQFTSDFCFGETVKVAHKGVKDRNGRYIGVVYNTKNENLNKALVAAGLAWHFKKYSDDDSYAQLENEARKAQSGLWSEETPIPPWEWRKKR